VTVADRAAVAAAFEAARGSAYPPGEYVGQESFMTAGEIRELARRARIGSDDSVLDLCCGVAGPGRLIAAETGCHYLGVDRDPAAVALARAEAGDLACSFEVGVVPPVPEGPFDVVLLLETMLAFRDKAPLLAGVAAALRPGGRFAFTVEEGRPLTAAERAAMPASDTVWPVPLPVLLALLDRHGFEVEWVADATDAHLETARALVAAFLGHRPSIVAELGTAAVDDLVRSHRLWAAWLGRGRIRKLGIVATR
jgi:SAM-dependent methyltransferase